MNRSLLAPISLSRSLYTCMESRVEYVASHRILHITPNAETTCGGTSFMPWQILLVHLMEKNSEWKHFGNTIAKFTSYHYSCQQRNFARFCALNGIYVVHNTFKHCIWIQANLLLMPYFFMQKSFIAYNHHYCNVRLACFHNPYIHIYRNNCYCFCS